MGMYLVIQKKRITYGKIFVLMLFSKLMPEEKYVNKYAAQHIA